jgi:hypothetical protein
MSKAPLRQKSAALLAACVALLLPGPSPGADPKEKKPSPEAVKALKAAVQLLNSNQLDPAIKKLQFIVETYPKDPAAEKAQSLLRDNGVAEELRVELFDRAVFRDKFKMPEKDILDIEEKILKELRFRFKGIKPFFKKNDLRLLFYDSQARYREKGGIITAAGHFGVNTSNYEAQSLQGKIEWYFPREAGSAKDRLTFMRGLLYHETSHYLNAIHFAGILPSPLDEGIATYFQSRLNTESYQYDRHTDRQRLEDNARNALNTIKKYDDFLKMLEAARGFGQGDAMVSRWYGLCYAMVDFLCESGIGGKKATLEQVLEKLVELTHSRAKSPPDRGAPPRLGMRPVLEALVQHFYGAKLEDFHRELLKYILAQYKQR